LNGSEWIDNVSIICFVYRVDVFFYLTLMQNLTDRASPNNLKLQQLLHPPMLDRQKTLLSRLHNQLCPLVGPTPTH
jgi:hypothetical protein